MQRQRQRQRQRRGTDALFGTADIFGTFRGFGMMPSLFGDQDPFDDPFFSRPFGSLFGSSRLERIPSSTAGGVAYHNHTRTKDLVIEELASDDEGEMDGVKTGEKKHNHQICRGSSAEPSVEHPDEDEAENEHDHDHDHDVYVGDSEDKDVNHRIARDKAERTEPLRRNFSFQTCKVTYGGVNGTYYTSTRTRRAGSDGVVIEERKEADKTTGAATHKITRGIHDKGHSVTRKLNADGNVDASQTLHNLNEDELSGFEEAWKGNFGGPVSSWSSQFNKHGGRGSSSSELDRIGNRGGWLLPSNAKGREPDSESSTSSSGGRTRKVIRINID